tara:strand:- start:904507 stop:905193 length:687 start_codon:yes stop_codon:yes gene_type:complete
MSDPIITPRLFKFLRELKKNNNRDWFAENKPRYESDVRDPAVELVRRLEKPLAKVAPMLMAIPKGHGGSVMRIYKDTRFSKDKTPYKTNVGISLRHQACKDIHAPGVYIHLEPNECFVGAGCWRPEKNVLAATRAAIDTDPQGWKRARDNKAFRQSFELAGESLKTKPRDYPADHPMIDDLKRIDFIAVAPLTPKDFVDEKIVDKLIDHVKRSKPLMRFLCDAIEIPY